MVKIPKAKLFFCLLSPFKIVPSWTCQNNRKRVIVIVWCGFDPTEILYGPVTSKEFSSLCIQLPSVYSLAFGINGAWVSILMLPLIKYSALGKSVGFSEP